MSEPGAGPLDDSKRRQLVALLEKISAVANHARPWARGLTLTAALSASWLAYYVHDLTGSSLTVTGIVLFILLIPALITGWLWSLLADLVELPEIAERTLGNLRQMAGARAHENKPSSGVSGVFTLGESLKQAASLAWEAEGLRGVIVGVLVLANPLFLMVLAIALLAGVVLAFIAGLTGILALLF